MRVSLLMLVAASVAAGCATAKTTQIAEASLETADAPLIPRKLIFGNPERSQARLSPDGSTLSWLAPDEGVVNVWVAPTNELASARAITKDRGRGIGSYLWSTDGTHIVYIQDRGGDENFHAYSVNVETGAEVDLTPFDGVRAQLMAQTWNQRGIMAIGINNRDARWHDVYLINLETGERSLQYENTADIGGFWLDDDLKIRLGSRSNPDGSNNILKYTADGWTEFYTIPYEDALTTSVVGFDQSGDSFYARESIGRDKAALVKIDFATGDREVLGQSERADVSSLLQHPVTSEVEAYSVNYLKLEWRALSDAVAADFEFLRGELEGEIFVVSRTEADNRWVIAQSRAEAPTDYHLYDRETRALKRLFSERPKLEEFSLQPMRPLELKSRDGLTLVSYLTLPPGADRDGDGRLEAPVPLALAVHGGPWGRDGYGYRPWHQWLANRGYAVLSVNFRSSTGFGKSFVTAGDNEWSKKMHDDLLDAVQWAIDEGITSADQVAIMGGSYGGYATLVGLTFTPNTFACGVDIVGMSNMKTTLDSVPPYWASFFEQLAKAVGDPRTEDGKAQLKAISPLFKADQIVKPLLIGQGANDPRVKQKESDQIVEAMKLNDIPVTYILFPDEGHGFRRPENRLAFYSVMESFLSECLGGRYEPVGDAFAGSSLTVPHGSQFAPGLTKALDGHVPEIRGN